MTGGQRLIIAQNSSFYKTTIQFTGSTGNEYLQFENDVPGSYAEYRSSAIYRDPSAWYHILCAVDTTNATDTNRMKMYVNGSQITMNIQGSYPTQNVNTIIGSNNPHVIGAYSDGTMQFFDGYMAEINYINGQTLTPSSFGQTDSATGVWVPKKYSGTYGTNGFYLKFADASAATAAAIGKDSSGNGNNFTPSGISVTSGVTYDQMTDTPTLNYATGNAVFIPSTYSLVDFRAANLEWGQAASNKNCSGVASIDMRTGKWYWETTVGTVAGNITFGVSRSDLNSTFRGTGTVYYRQDGQKVVDGVNSAYGASYVANDVLGFAYDADAGTLTCYKNNASQGTITITSGSSYGWFPACALDNAGAGVTAFHTFNFGQRAFSYTPPTGFKALNTANLQTPSIKKGSLYMDATLRTGTGATASVSSLGFQPDFVWIKSRSNATAHNLFNSVIGATKGIQTTGPNAQYTDVNSLTSFNSNGYSLGSDASSRGVNINTNTYVNWAWKESTTAGLDILSWTGNGAGPRTINHALGVTPEFMMLRGTDARAWACWFNSMTSAAYYMDLGTAAAEAVDTTMFDSTAPTSTTFRVGSYNNVNAITYVGYFFSSISGFSRIGSYTGNASTDGPFVWCGFSPKFVMVKGVDIATGWFMVNPSNSANEVVVRVFSDTTGAETSNTYGLDLLSNGFKVRAPSGYSLNNSGNKYAFIAFAENPFKYSRAR